MKEFSITPEVVKLGGDVYEMALNQIRFQESEHYLKITSKEKEFISLELDFQMRTNRTDRFEMRYTYGASDGIAKGEYRIADGPFHTFSSQADGNSSISGIVFRNYEEFVAQVAEFSASCKAI